MACDLAVPWCRIGAWRPCSWSSGFPGGEDHAGERVRCGPPGTAPDPGWVDDPAVRRVESWRQAWRAV